MGDSAGSGNEADVFHLAHAYDRASNRLYAHNQVYGSSSQVYGYDELHRLTEYEQGLFDDSTPSGGGAIESWWRTARRAWTLDQSKGSGVD